MNKAWRVHVGEDLEQHPEIYQTSPWTNAQELELDHVRSEMLATKDQLIEIIRMTKNKGAAGLDKIDHWTLKRLANNTLDQLLRILNACVILSYFPSRWKEAYTTMILKPAKDGAYSANYRPISLCSVLGKILEKMYLRAFEKFLNDNNLQRAR